MIAGFTVITTTKYDKNIRFHFTGHDCYERMARLYECRVKQVTIFIPTIY